MSRSRRKHPIIKYHDKVDKRYANRKVRLAKDITNYSGYKRVWDIYEQRDDPIINSYQPNYKEWFAESKLFRK